MKKLSDRILKLKKGDKYIFILPETEMSKILEAMNSDHKQVKISLVIKEIKTIIEQEARKLPPQEREKLLETLNRAIFTRDRLFYLLESYVEIGKPLLFLSKNPIQKRIFFKVLDLLEHL
jgi:hypothetical protein